MKAVLAAVSLTLLSSVTAQAQKRDDMWCRDMAITPGGSSAMICSAYTYQQCMASRASPNERCYRNPRYGR